MRLMVLAAGQGTRLRPITNDRPKCLVEIGGRPLIEWTIEAAVVNGISDIVVIGGYRADLLKQRGYQVLLNPRYESTNMVRTLFCAESLFADGFIMSYGDIAYSPTVLSRLLTIEAPVVAVVDRQWQPYWEERFNEPLADAETLSLDAESHITDIGGRPSSIAEIQAQYIGLVSFRGAGVPALIDAYREAEAADRSGRHAFDSLRTLDRAFMTDLIQGMINRGTKVTALPIDRGWVEVDSMNDLHIAERYAASGGLN